jgi:hypothetical protein
LQTIDPAPAWRLRELHALGDFGRRQVCIVLQQPEDFAIDGAKLDLHELTLFYSLNETGMQNMSRFQTI